MCTAGSAQFYLATFFSTAIWLGSWLLRETVITFLATHRANLLAALPLAQRSWSFTQLIIYITATAAMSISLLLITPILIGDIAELKAPPNFSSPPPHCT